MGWPVAEWNYRTESVHFTPLKRNTVTIRKDCGIRRAAGVVASTACMQAHRGCIESENKIKHITSSYPHLALLATTAEYQKNFE